jgi:hypothetical protein
VKCRSVSNAPHDNHTGKRCRILSIPKSEPTEYKSYVFLFELHLSAKNPSLSPPQLSQLRVFPLSTMRNTGKRTNNMSTRIPLRLSFQAMLPIQEVMFPFLRGIGMARGRRTSFTIRLTDEERQTLLAWQRSTIIPAGIARRGRIILLMADRVPISHIATTVGISRRFVYKWVQRFLHEGLAGLVDKRERSHLRGPHLHDLLNEHDRDVG